MGSPPNRPLESTPAPAIGPEQLRAWMVQYGPALRRYFMKKVSAAEAEDLVQDVFLSVQSRGAGAEIENIEGYLFRAAANVLVRRRQRQRWDWDRHAALDEAPEPSDDLSPERVLMGKQAVDRLVGALNDLPPRTAEAFFLHRFEDMTYEAIARRMGVSVKAVEDLMRRALRRLSDRLEADA
ncbi:MAG: RNA polymerase sigma factor [Parcubacteria group bacterium]